MTSSGLASYLRTLYNCFCKVRGKQFSLSLVRLNVRLIFLSPHLISTLNTPTLYYVDYLFGYFSNLKHSFKHSRDPCVYLWSSRHFTVVWCYLNILPFLNTITVIKHLFELLVKSIYLLIYLFY